MSFGLPTHLARGANSHAIANASQWGGLVCLAAALAMVLLTAASGAGTHFGAGLWPTVLAILPMMALLVALRRMRTVLLTVTYLVVGALGTLLYTLTLLTRTPAFHDTRLFIIALPVIAMIAVGGAGAGALAGVLWSTVGFVLAEAAVLVAAMIAGRAFLPDVTSLMIYLLLAGVMILETGFVGSARHAPQAMIHRAVRDVHMSQVRHQLAVRFASDLHDEVLSELIAIGSSEPGPLSPRLRRAIERDLASVGRDAAGGTGATVGTGAGLGAPAAAGAAGPPDQEPASGDPWLGSAVRDAVEQSLDDGLAINVSGDTRLLATLTPEQDQALGLAARQCLVNVLRHAGTLEADVAISGSTDDVSVMVVDAGRGFVPDASVAETRAGTSQTGSGSDHLGLRASVRQRVEAVGGTVTIWSSPGIGTTVLMEIDLTDARASPAQVGPTGARGEAGARGETGVRRDE